MDGLESGGRIRPEEGDSKVHGVPAELPRGYLEKSRALAQVSPMNTDMGTPGRACENVS